VYENDKRGIWCIEVKSKKEKKIQIKNKKVFGVMNVMNELKVAVGWLDSRRRGNDKHGWRGEGKRGRDARVTMITADAGKKLETIFA